MPSDALVRVVIKKKIGDRNSIRYSICKSHRRFVRNHVWEQHGETRCVITVTKNKSLVLISEYKENQID